MVSIKFLPSGATIDVESNTKILIAALKLKLPIRYGCASCQCGTCAVKLSCRDELSEMKISEKRLLEKMHLPVDGSVRLSCQTRVVSGECEVDLDFQNTYTPEDSSTD